MWTKRTTSDVLWKYILLIIANLNNMHLWPKSASILTDWKTKFSFWRCIWCRQYKMCNAINSILYWQNVSIILYCSEKSIKSFFHCEKWIKLTHRQFISTLCQVFQCSFSLYTGCNLLYWEISYKIIILCMSDKQKFTKYISNNVFYRTMKVKLVRWSQPLMICKWKKL